MAVTKAHVKASKKYNKANYKKLQANIKPDDYTFIDNYCKNTNISKATLIVNAIKYCITNNVDVTNITNQDPTQQK